MLEVVDQHQREGIVVEVASFQTLTPGPQANTGNKNSHAGVEVHICS